jgi:hypothetical protein
MTDLVTDLGATSYLLIYTGSPPVNCAASATGTLLASLPCSVTFGAVSSGVLTANAIGNVTVGGGGGTAGYWRLCTNSAGTTCHAQGLCFPVTILSTNASTSSGNILPFAATSGVVAGQTVSGTNIPTATYVLAVGSTSVTLNNNIAGTVGNAASITFGGELSFSGGVVLANGQTLAVSSLVLTATGV